MKNDPSSSSSSSSSALSSSIFLSYNSRYTQPEDDTLARSAIDCKKRSIFAAPSSSQNSSFIDKKPQSNAGFSPKFVGKSAFASLFQMRHWQMSHLPAWGWARDASLTCNQEEEGRKRNEKEFALHAAAAFPLLLFPQTASPRKDVLFCRFLLGRRRSFSGDAETSKQSQGGKMKKLDLLAKNISLPVGKS